MPAMLMLSLLLAPAVSPAPSATPAITKAATLADFAWMEGRWRSESEGTLSEETWHAARGESMLGSFRMVGGDGVVVFYEILILKQTPAGVEMRLKHFDTNLHSREEKDAPMVFAAGDVAKNGATFTRTVDGKTERLVYKRDGEAMKIRVERPERKAVEFVLSLAK